MVIFKDLNKMYSGLDIILFKFVNGSVYIEFINLAYCEYLR